MPEWLPEGGEGWRMIPMVEDYERCWHLGAYTGQECELCPHRAECSARSDDDEEEDDDRK